MSDSTTDGAKLRGRAGERNSLWKGDTASYSAIRDYLAAHYPKSGKCEDCDRVTATRYALIHGRPDRSRNREDYRELCPRCHIRYIRGDAPPEPYRESEAPGSPSAGDPAVICLRGTAWRLWPCRIWSGDGSVRSAGYGRRHVQGSGPGRKYVAVHREALEQKLGRPLRQGMFALHHCDTPSCYEGQHLYEGTQLDNMRDRSERGRWRGNGRRCLTQEEKLEIRRRYNDGGISYARLAAELGLSKTTIERAVNGS